MYSLEILRSRVDYGNDIFGDAEFEETVLTQGKTLKSLIENLKTLYAGRNLQIVELLDDTLTIDTNELTLWLLVRKTSIDDSSTDLSTNELEELASLVKGEF